MEGGDRFDQMATNITDLKVMVAEIGTTMKSHTEDLKDLKSDMKQALIPIKFFKGTVAALGALSLFIGVIYGTIQIFQAINPPTP